MVASGRPLSVRERELFGSFCRSVLLTVDAAHAISSDWAHNGRAIAPAKLDGPLMPSFADCPLDDERITGLCAAVADAEADAVQCGGRRRGTRTDESTADVRISSAVESRLAWLGRWESHVRAIEDSIRRAHAAFGLPLDDSWFTHARGTSEPDLLPRQTG